MHPFGSDFLQRLDGARLFAGLFEDSADLFVFAKDRECRFTLCNRTLLRKMGMEEEQEILGRDDYEFFDRSVADRYREEDREVFDGGKPVTNRIWLVPNASGIMEWYLSSKFPVFDRKGVLMGLLGMMRDCRQGGVLPRSYGEMSRVIDFIHEHYPEPIRVGELAALTQQSVSQFERRFKQLFKLTPLRYINQVRLDAAARMLLDGNETVTAIAHAVGLYDHSYLAKRFRAAFGQSPAEYRRSAVAPA